ncbi:MAG: divergent PAP2 family protein [Candidatus Omnitrophica bacterium]|nr:divergent PAP2 family protein [Candidatus Omnitrophota bacterium]MDD5080864.1 divergent PAP2 family protein [Candidatus Omnitrophota bacterium]
MEFFSSKIIWATFFSWAIAQGIKIVIGLQHEKKFNFYWLLRTGGMPSAHSAAVMALASSIGKVEGFDSPIFVLSLGFALITMFDAQTWRRYIGVQARILNKMMEDIQEKGKIEEKKLRELVGHTPMEVFVGALIGVFITLVFFP